MIKTCVHVSFCCSRSFQTLILNRMATRRRLIGIVPPTARIPSADTGTDEGLPNLQPTPSPPKTQQDITDWDTEQDVYISPIFSNS